MSGRRVLSAIVSTLVDVLPRELWRPANLYFLPRGHTLHFCYGSRGSSRFSVRTVELDKASRTIGRGRRRRDAELAFWEGRESFWERHDE